MGNSTIMHDERLRLAEVDRLTSDLASGSDPVLNSVVAMLCGHFEVPTALVSIIDRNYQVFKARVGMVAERTPREMSFCALELEQDTVLEICDALTDARTIDNPLVQGDPYIRYYAGAPLVIKPGLSLGGCASSTRRHVRRCPSATRRCCAARRRLLSRGCSRSMSNISTTI